MHWEQGGAIEMVKLLLTGSMEAEQIMAIPPDAQVMLAVV